MSSGLRRSRRSPAGREPVDREVADVAVALVGRGPPRGRRRACRTRRRADRSSRTASLPPLDKLQRLVDLAALEHGSKMPSAGGQVPTQTVAPASASALAIAKPNPPSSATPATRPAARENRSSASRNRGCEQEILHEAAGRSGQTPSCDSNFGVGVADAEDEPGRAPRRCGRSR